MIAGFSGSGSRTPFQCLGVKVERLAARVWGAAEDSQSASSVAASQSGMHASRAQVKRASAVQLFNGAERGPSLTFNLTASSPQASRGTAAPQPMGLCQAAHPEHAARRRLTNMHLRRAATSDFAPASPRPSCEASSTPSSCASSSPEPSTALHGSGPGRPCGSPRHCLGTKSPPFDRCKRFVLHSAAPLVL